MVERGPEKAGVGGPIPFLGTIIFLQVPTPSPPAFYPDSRAGGEELGTI